MSTLFFFVVADESTQRFELDHHVSIWSPWVIVLGAGVLLLLVDDLGSEQILVDCSYVLLSFVLRRFTVVYLVDIIWIFASRLVLIVDRLFIFTGYVSLVVICRVCL